MSAGEEARARWRELAMRVEEGIPIPGELRRWAPRAIYAMLGDPVMGGRDPGPAATAGQRAESIAGGRRHLSADEIAVAAGLKPPAHRPPAPELWLRDRLLAAEVAALVDAGRSVEEAIAATAERNAVSDSTVKLARRGRP